MKKVTVLLLAFFLSCNLLTACSTEAETTQSLIPSEVVASESKKTTEPADEPETQPVSEPAEDQMTNPAEDDSIDQTNPDGGEEKNKGDQSDDMGIF